MDELKPQPVRIAWLSKDLTQDVLLIAIVDDGEVLGESDEVRVRTQESHAETVKRRDREATSRSLA